MTFILCKRSAAMRMCKSKWIASYAGVRGTLAGRASGEAAPDTPASRSYIGDQRATTSALSCTAIVVSAKFPEADLCGFAAKTLPVLRRHLQGAQGIAGTMAGREPAR